MRSLTAREYDIIRHALDSVSPYIPDDDDPDEILYTRDLFEAMYVAAATNRWMTAYESIKYVPSILDSTKIIMPKLGYAHQSRKSMRRSIIDKSKHIKY